MPDPGIERAMEEAAQAVYTAKPDHTIDMKQLRRSIMKRTAKSRAYLARGAP